MRPDGSILDRPGYDPESGIYYDPRRVVFPEIPAAPTRMQALAALDRLETLFATLDLVDEIAHSAALSALMTPILRSAMTLSRKDRTIKIRDQTPSPDNSSVCVMRVAGAV